MILLMERKIQIYFVDNDPKLAAQALVDEHIPTQIRNSAQILCNAHRVLDGIRYCLMDEREHIFYKARNLKDPWSIWCKESLENYFWIEEYLYDLLDEYKNRFKKPHKILSSKKQPVGMSYFLQSPPFNLKDGEWTNPPLTIPNCYKSLELEVFDGYSLQNIINSYRCFYILSAQYIRPFEVGKHYNPPDWLKRDRDLQQMLSGNN
jgi:hypothetical protein